MENELVIKLKLSIGDSIFSMEKNLIKERTVVLVSIEVTEDGTAIKYGSKEKNVDKNVRYTKDTDAFASKKSLVENLMRIS